MNLLHFYGQFHPASTHLPVALLLVAALAEGIALFRRSGLWREVAALNLVVGAVAAVVTATMGWALAATMGMEVELRATLWWHRWLGTGVAVWSVLTVGLWWRDRLRPEPGRALPYRVALLGGAMLVAVTGHLGGLLVYGLDYYTSPFPK